ncbi:Uncharacterized damage-inducible protein DinB (forms a four-helix bundle) [Catalinimonas alkaloidigena]|uniref:Uncharacterized damage-inducible protein DinB (Forms a four-helix bundle) n=1 Tax=Catalinimonas alkaloidigena TaxID=1075417 RepID=A0A1G9BAC2_9BACT|nr:putative metal-dependent hydrolase [Catalinimonas alkaloidigena]SDK36532.1 Uncharacterized damage-inducible protein DinB (forms a four-helix bundle) [Catalinimonas alkaloidigena]
MSSFSFPIGTLEAQPEQPRAEQIEAIAQLPAQLLAAVSGLSDEQLDTPYRPGGWTVRQLVHHVADSHMNGYIRWRLALTENNPTIKPYDQAAWAELPDAAQEPIEVSLRLLDSVHQRWSVLLRALPDEAFERTYQHPEMGSQTLLQSLANYAWHGRHHVAHVTELRKRLEW